MTRVIVSPRVWRVSVAADVVRVIAPTTPGVRVVTVGLQGVPGTRGERGPAGSDGGEVPAPTLPIVDAKSSSDLAAGASVNLDSVVIVNGAAGKLQQITLSSSAAAKWVIKKSESGIDTTLDVVFTSGSSGQTPSHEWEPPHQDYTEITGNGSDVFFRVTATNLDSRNAANCYTTYFINEIAP